MPKARYTPTPPNHPGWWWMKVLEKEEPVEVQAAGDGRLFLKMPGGDGSGPPLKMLEGVLWSLYPITPPSKVSSTQVRLILGDHAVEVHIGDEELLQTLIPDKILNRYVAQAMMNLFEEVVEPRRKAWEESLTTHRDLMKFLGDRSPDILNDFLASKAGA